MYEKNKGFEYEKIARKYLLDKNYKIIKENFSCKFGEIDIIAENSHVLHFIEVKGRKNLDHGYPRESVNLTKQKKIIGAAKYYFFLTGMDDVSCQFDVVEIILEDNIINFIENAFWT